MVLDGDDPVAFLYAEWAKPNAPAYESNKDHLWLSGSVLRPHRRRGIGTALARRALALMDESGTTIATLDAEEPEGKAFLDWIGATAKMEAAENRLDLDEVDWAMVEEWVRSGKERSPETRLEQYVDRLPEEHWEEYANVLSDLLNLMPFDDLEHGEIKVTAESLAEFFARSDDLGAAVHVFATREPDGTISGITDVRYIPSRPDRVEQLFTGVRPTSRGRGLGKLLKAAMLLHIRGEHPQARWVITGNAESNAPMLAINRRLGFKTYRGETAYQITRDELRDALGAIE
jgi:GNAT superfamily N-acetyltransferase